MREPAARRAVIDAAVFDAALVRVVERTVGSTAADNAGARVMARLAARRWYPTVPQLLAAPAAALLVMVMLWQAPRSQTPIAPSTAGASPTAPSTAADDVARGAAADAAALHHRGADPRAAIGVAPVAIATSARRRGRPRPGPATVDDPADTVPALAVADVAAVSLVELSEPTPGPAPLPVDRLALPSIDAAALDAGRHR
jgi:hypothetical protein